MKRFLTLMLILLAVLTACGGDGNLREGRELRQMSRALGLDLSAGVLARYEDSHGGFLGDGLTAAEVEIGGLDGRLGDLPGWRPLPLSENGAEALELVGGPEGVEEGFYYLYDRHSQSQDPFDDSDLHQRFSWNFTIAVYDSRNERLYYYEFDT